MQIERAKLPKALSYPAKSTVLADALSQAGIPFDAHLILAPSKIFFDAHFWPPNANVPRERIYIRVGAVPRSEAHAARTFMAEVAIPEFVGWLKELAAFPVASPKRHAEHYFRKDWDRAPN
jgi:hypothetical protein